MNKNIIIITIVLISSFGSFAQNTRVADRYFKEFAYVKSAELYEASVKRGDSSMHTLSRLGDSYYNNSQSLEAEKWYGLLLDKYEDVDPEYVFKYAQTLKSNGKESASKQWFNKFATLNPDDTRLAALLSDIKLSEKENVIYESVTNSDFNTEYSDFNGVIDQNNNLYVYSTKPSTSGSKIYKWNKQPFLDIYTVEEGSNTLLDLPGDINTKYHESNVAITKDGQTLYFTRDNYDGRRLRKDDSKTANLKLYKATFKDEKWEDIVELPFNSDDYSVGHPALNNTEDTLYFVSDMPGAIGGSDIYKVSINGNDFGTPERLSDKINTFGMEMFPFIGEDDMLYFSSNGHKGYGLLDIFKTNLDTEDVYNLGNTINSNKDDFGFVSRKGKGYFSSNREGGKGDDDVYAFNLIDVCFNSISGIAYDNITKAILPNTEVVLLDANGMSISKVKSDSKGAFLFKDLDCNKTFTISGKKPNYKEVLEQAETASLNNEDIKADLYLNPLIKEVAQIKQIIINPIYFDLNKSNIRPDAAYELENVVDVLRANPSMVINVESHTDSRAPDSYNMSLSDRRAKSTRDYILSRGIDSSQINSAIGYGESQLVNHCTNGVKCTETEHQENRRSLFIIIKD